MFCVLVADDEIKIRETIRDYLSAKGIDVTTASNGTEALEAIEEKDFDLVILDVMMPELNGFDACRIIRRNSNVPVLFLTAKSQEQDYLAGYESGCDDYVAKPFPLSVLYEKSMSLIKRYKGIDNNNIISAGGISLSLSSHCVEIDGETVSLTSKDFKLLYYLMQNKNIVLNRDLILTYVWGYDFDGDSRVVDTHIKRLRKALGSKSSCIKTVVNIGYSFQEV